MYEPTEYQKSTFKVVDGGDSTFYLELRGQGYLPTKSIRIAHQYSIAKWWVIRDALAGGKLITYDGSVDTCALCRVTKMLCLKECPIGMHMRKNGCNDTPYDDFETGYPLPGIDEQLDAARREVEFLQGLYEEEYGE